MSTFLDYYNIMNAFSEFVVKSVYAHQKFTVKNVDQIPKFIAFLRFGGILYLQYEIGGASMYRIAMEKLLKWKESKRRKPLIIEGARQVGKTWLMKEFGRLYYTDTVYINFDSNSRMAELFASDLDTERLIMGLELYSGRKIDPDHTLLILMRYRKCQERSALSSTFTKMRRSTTLYAQALCWALPCMKALLSQWVKWTF